MVSQLPLEANPQSQVREPARPAAGKALLILGVTTDGVTFRPSDWAQRLALAATIDCDYCGPSKQLPCNPMVRVVNQDGVSGVRVSPDLAERDRRLYEFVLRFARLNKLVVREVS